MSGQSSDEYLSPLKKLVTFFRNSRDQWKAKHHEVKKMVKMLQSQTRACRTESPDLAHTCRIGRTAGEGTPTGD